MMMRNILSGLFLLLVLSSCEKEEENGMDFKITGLRDTTIERGQEFSLPLKVFYLGGAKENVTVTASGNGNGVSITFDPVSGEPNYSFTQYLKATAAADTGVYTITVTGTSESKKQFSKSFALHVTEVANSAPVIFLNAGDTVPHQLNAQWFDPGYTATDAEDGVLTAQVTVSGTVNENLSASYLLTYSVTDSEGTTTTATRLVRVLNDVNFVNGQYTCTTITTGSPVQVWITTLASSLTVNNRFKIFKIGDYFQADPEVTYNPANDSIYLASQTFLCISPTDTLLHTFVGAGKVLNHTGSTVGIELVYTDSFTDPGTGQPVTLNKRDIYNK